MDLRLGMSLSSCIGAMFVNYFLSLIPALPLCATALVAVECVGCNLLLRACHVGALTRVAAGGTATFPQGRLQQVTCSSPTPIHHFH